jgi:hypothetical protein
MPLVKNCWFSSARLRFFIFIRSGYVPRILPPQTWIAPQTQHRILFCGGRLLSKKSPFVHSCAAPCGILTTSDGRNGGPIRPAQQRQQGRVLRPARLVMNDRHGPLALRSALRARSRLFTCSTFRQTSARPSRYRCHVRRSQRGQWNNGHEPPKVPSTHAIGTTTF